MDNKGHCTYCLLACITPYEQPHNSYKMLTINKPKIYQNERNVFSKGKVTGNLVSMFQSQKLQRRRKIYCILCMKIKIGLTDIVLR